MSLDKFNEAPSGDVNLTDGTSLEREKKAIQDNQDLQCLQQLRKAKWFRSYYERRMKEKREVFVKELCADQHHEMSLILRARIQLIDDLLAMPEGDRQIKWKALNPGTPAPED